MPHYRRSPNKHCTEMAASESCGAEDVNRYGEVVVDMWKVVTERTTEARFGAALRKLLLSGTVCISCLVVSTCVLVNRCLGIS